MQPGVKDAMVVGKIEGDLGEQGKRRHPQTVFHPVMGVDKALHHQKAE